MDKLTQLIHDRLEQLHREAALSYLDEKTKEYHQVRIDELETILRLIELKG